MLSVTLTICSIIYRMMPAFSGTFSQDKVLLYKLVMDEERQKAYLTLINSLLNSSNSQVNSILNANQLLVDAGLVQTMKQVASVMAEQGYQNAADFLINVACQLSEIITSSKNVTDRAVAQDELLAKTKQEEYLIFLDQVYEATAQSNSNPQVVYPLLADNLEKLNDDFAVLLRQVIIDTLAQVEPEQAQSIAAVIGNFSDLMREFPQGDRASNLEIAIAGAEVAATVFTRDAYPKDWATNRNNLAAAYTKSVRGDREENLERAIAAHEEALQVYTQSQFPTEWARTQSNLGNAYSDRIRSDRTQNLEQAIRCYLAALQVRTQEAFPYEWATTQNNLGAAYWNRIEGERAQNLELAIAAFQAALQVYTQQDFPEDWARTQNNLGVPYRDRIQGEQRVNLEAAIAHFQATQQVKPISYSEIKTLLDDRTAIVEWYICNDNFHTFITTHSSERPLVWSSSAEEMQALMDWQNEYLQGYQQNCKEWIEKLPESLQNLAEILHIDEIISHLPAECDRLILIPHRFLHLLPLHALPLGNKQLANGQKKQNSLLDKFPRCVGYAPSCQLLQLSQNQQRPNFSKFFAIQNPTGDLSYTNLEVEIIGSFFAETQVLVKQEATKVALNDNNNLKLAHCCHFCCHGDFNLASPLESALILADNERLTLAEIFALNLNQCRLITLSACETGIADPTNISDEYISLPSGFLYAGSPKNSCINILWYDKGLF